MYIILNSRLKNMDSWRMANTVFMLGTVLGAKLDSSYFGHSVSDASGIVHAPIGNTVLPILCEKEENMNNFYKKCKGLELQNDFTVLDFTLTAQNSNKYEEYSQKLSLEKTEDQTILGIALFGDQKNIKSLCGSLPRWK